ncbi:JAB domain-containing protein [Paenibacillus sp. FSL R5-0473]|uniref:JAB domain-containing protein n=1 Tax=Paenibacillus sp. FSL R5-0473 TaxID=2921642 RepID=UPI004046D9B5
MSSLNATIVHPREVFHAAIKHCSASIICAHNHPSGDSTPSPGDLNFTKRLVEVGKTIGINVLDHVKSAITAIPIYVRKILCKKLESKSSLFLQIHLI